MHAHPLAVAKAPLVRATQRRKRDAVVGGEGPGGLGNAASFQVFGACADHRTRLTDPGRQQRAVGQMADAHGEVEMLLDQTQWPVRKQQLHVHIGVCLQESRRDGHDVQPTENDGRGDHQLAMRCVIFAGCATIGLGDLLENVPASLQIGLTDFGQRQLACRTHQQLRIEMRFQLGNLAADGRQRHVQLTAGAGEAARPGDCDEHCHGFEAVHPNVPKIERVFTNNTG